MTGRSVRFFVVGTPAPQGSKRHVGGGRMVESSKAVGPWRSAVAWQASSAVRSETGSGFDGAVEVDVDFYLARPKSAPKSRRWPDRKPDIDKLLRSTLDGLTESGCIADDARVVAVRCQKLYAAPGDRLGADITVSAAAEATA